MVPGRRGLALLCAARTDFADQAGDALGWTTAEVDALLGEGDGTHLVRVAG